MRSERTDSLLLPPAPGHDVPVLPESAPFTAEQRAWLNGFLAGLLSRAPGAAPSAAQGTTNRAGLKPLTILFGSQTGNAEGLARRVAKAAGQHGFAPTLCDLAQYDCGSLTQERNLLLLTSTFGDGEPPENARSFWKFLSRDTAPSLSQLRFSVCALGDSNYEKFYQCGKDFDRRLGELQGKRIAPRIDCDVDFDEAFHRWLDSVWPGFEDPEETSSPQIPSVRAGVELPAVEPAAASAPAWSRTRPFPAHLVTNRLLNGPGSAKETRHFEFNLADSGFSYEAGDALGVVPTNCPELVDEIIAALGASPDAPVPGRTGEPISLRRALLELYEITRIPKPLLALFAERTKDPQLQKLCAPNVNGELDKFLWGREILDLLLAYPDVKLAPEEFAGLLRKLQPRCYSIASSQKMHREAVHLTVAIVRYTSLGRTRQGVCSTYLADRVQDGAPVSVYVQTNKAFRLPTDSTRSIIMVGPGTGIAPFRAFLQERQATRATGKNWLFFGDQREATDFLYRDELSALAQQGTLTHLHTAFSRDQQQKLYVQQRMLENASELFAWLEDGAHFYVCGDANRMARDVDAALHQAIERASGKSPEQVADYVETLRTQRRYQRDVY